MTTLHDQIRIHDDFLTPEVRAERGQVADTTLSARIGRSGTERHAIHVTIWEATADRPHPLAGQVVGGRVMPAIIKGQPRHWSGGRTYCGSQRFGSGAHSYSMTEPVTCERCLDRGFGLSAPVYPEDVLVDTGWEIKVR